MRFKKSNMAKRSFPKVLIDKNQNEYNKDNHVAETTSLNTYQELQRMPSNDKVVRDYEHANSMVYKIKKQLPEFQGENYNLYKSPPEKVLFRNNRDDFALFKKQQQPQTVGKDHFSRLSDEIILHIFHMLPKSVLIKCSPVCKRWRELSYDETLWRRHDFGRKVVKSGTLEVLLKRGVSVLRLAMSEVRQPLFSNAYLNIHPWRCKLQYLDLSMAMIKPQSLAQLLSKCCSLKKLSVEHCILNENCCTNIAENDGLEVLNMAMCEGLTQTGLHAITVCCKKLTEWNLGWARFDEPCLETVLSSVPTSLKRLNLSGHRHSLTDAALIEVVKRCRDLRELDVSDNALLTNVSIEVLIKSCHNLQHLHTSRSYNIPTETNKLLKNLKSFENLEIFQTLTDGALESLREYMPHIKINQHMFSTIGRPTVGIKRTSVWGKQTRD